MDAILAYLFWTIVTATVSFALAEAMKKKPKIPNAKPSNLEWPEIEEGRPYGVIFGTPKFVSNPTVAWWGDISTRAIRKKVGEKFDWKWGMGGHKGSHNPIYQTVGYHYSAGVEFKLCHGPIDGVKQIRAADKVAWPNPDDPTELADDGETSITIDLPNLFGGEDGEGGIVGSIDIEYGASSQAVNAYLASKLGADISAGRGLVRAILKQVNIGTSKYPKPWSFLLKRTDILDDGSPQWYKDKADISGDLNAAHVLRECYTNTRWGLGYSDSLIDSTSWLAAADTLHTEGFGVSRHWYDANESIEDLIRDVLTTINGRIYQDPETGLFVFRLAREVVGELESFDESDIDAVENFGRECYGEIPDVVNVRITDVLNNTVTAIPDHDIAVMDIQGGKSIPLERDFFAVTKPVLGGQLAARERQLVTSMLATMTIKGKRTMAHLRPFDVIKISSAAHRIVQLVVRVIDTNFGTLEDGKVTLHCVEDVFRTHDAIFSAPPGTGWTDPVSEPAVAPNRLLVEAPFWSLVVEIGLPDPEIIDGDQGWLMVAAQKPSSDALDYEAFIRPSGSDPFVSDGRGTFTPTATLAETMPLNAVDQIVDLANIVNLDQVAVNTYAMVGSEIVKVTAVDTANSRVTLARGVLDTVPTAHSITDRIWFLGSANYIGAEQYEATDTPGVKVCPRTGKGQLAEASAPIDNATAFNSRAIRPYPPGNLKINTVSYPSTFTGQPTLTWTHRDRTQQITELVEHDAAGIGPESGVTYTLKIYAADNIRVHTETGITGTTYEYTEAHELSDFGGLQTQLRFVLYAVRAGYDSWQQYDLTVPRAFVINDSVGLTDARTVVRNVFCTFNDSVGLTDEATPVEG